MVWSWAKIEWKKATSECFGMSTPGRRKEEDLEVKTGIREKENYQHWMDRVRMGKKNKTITLGTESCEKHKQYINYVYNIWDFLSQNYRGVEGRN